MELRTWISASLSVVVWIRCSVHKTVVLLDVWWCHSFADIQICLFFFHLSSAVLLYSLFSFRGRGVDMGFSYSHETYFRSHCPCFNLKARKTCGLNQYQASSWNRVELTLEAEPSADNTHVPSVSSVGPGCLWCLNQMSSMSQLWYILCLMSWSCLWCYGSCRAVFIRIRIR
jgi:hypothetical protein